MDQNPVGITLGNMLSRQLPQGAGMETWFIFPKPSAVKITPGNATSWKECSVTVQDGHSHVESRMANIVLNIEQENC